jgi:zinc/manganese transport system ATP-binding protein/zinc transport system ATP-binding protein
MTSLIDVKKLSIGFQYPLQKDLNFSLNEGEILFVRGRNGSGKSTLIKTLCKNIKSLSGTVNWNIDLSKVSLLPQIVSHEFPLSITLGEILDLFNPKQVAKGLLSEHLYSRRFNDASGGERQKTLILTRLKSNTEILILDEPFNHLDQNASKEMVEFISKLIESKVIKGVILISHVDVEFENLNAKEVFLS